MAMRDARVLKTGELRKKRNFHLKGLSFYQKRFVVLKGGFMVWYSSEQAFIDGKPSSGLLRLNEVLSVRTYASDAGARGSSNSITSSGGGDGGTRSRKSSGVDGDKSNRAFFIVVNGDVYHWLAHSAAEASSWVRALWSCLSDNARSDTVIVDHNDDAQLVCDPSTAGGAVGAVTEGRSAASSFASVTGSVSGNSARDGDRKSVAAAAGRGGRANRLDVMMDEVSATGVGAAMVARGAFGFRYKKDVAQTKPHDFECVLEGWLWKSGFSNGQPTALRKRYFLLLSDGRLLYFKDIGAVSKGKAGLKGFIALFRDSQITVPSKVRSFCITPRPCGRTYHMTARSDTSYDTWIKTLKSMLEKMPLSASVPLDLQSAAAKKKNEPCGSAKLVPVTFSKACMLCEKAFGPELRRFHCRSCGKTVCGRCSRKTQTMGGAHAPKVAVRVCDECFLGHFKAKAKATLARSRAYSAWTVEPPAHGAQKKPEKSSELGIAANREAAASGHGSLDIVERTSGGDEEAQRLKKVTAMVAVAKSAAASGAAAGKAISKIESPDGLLPDRKRYFFDWSSKGRCKLHYLKYWIEFASVPEPELKQRVGVDTYIRYTLSWDVTACRQAAGGALEFGLSEAEVVDSRTGERIQIDMDELCETDGRFDIDPLLLFDRRFLVTREGRWIGIVEPAAEVMEDMISRRVAKREALKKKEQSGDEQRLRDVDLQAYNRRATAQQGDERALTLSDLEADLRTFWDASVQSFLDAEVVRKQLQQKKTSDSPKLATILTLPPTAVGRADRGKSVLKDDLDDLDALLADADADDGEQKKEIATEGRVDAQEKDTSEPVEQADAAAIEASRVILPREESDAIAIARNMQVLVCPESAKSGNETVHRLTRTLVKDPRDLLLELDAVAPAGKQYNKASCRIEWSAMSEPDSLRPHLAIYRRTAEDIASRGGEFEVFVEQVNQTWFFSWSDLPLTCLHERVVEGVKAIRAEYEYSVERLVESLGLEEAEEDDDDDDDEDVDQS